MPFNSKFFLEHFTSKKYKCNQCKASFSRKGNLQRHELCHTELKPYTCNECLANFRQKSHLVKHAKTHPSKCSMEIYTDNTSSSSLYKYNGNDVTFVKNEIPLFKDFTQGHNLAIKLEDNLNSECKRLDDSHKEIEMSLNKSSNKTFTCDQCLAHFKHKFSLQRHKLSHTNQRPFKCSQCSSAFRQKTHLEKHRLTHSKVASKFLKENSLCNNRFGRNSRLNSNKEEIARISLVQHSATEEATYFVDDTEICITKPIGVSIMQ